MQKVESNLSPMLPPKSPTQTQTQTQSDSSPLRDSKESKEDILENLFIDVSLPQVIEEFVTEKMLVMTFIDGFKVREERTVCVCVCVCVCEIVV